MWTTKWTLVVPNIGHMCCPCCTSIDARLQIFPLRQQPGSTDICNWSAHPIARNGKSSLFLTRHRIVSSAILIQFLAWWTVLLNPFFTRPENLTCSASALYLSSGNAFCKRRILPQSVKSKPENWISNCLRPCTIYKKYLWIIYICKRDYR